MRRRLILIVGVILLSGNFCLADCPSADVTGDCFVDFNDFALFAIDWPATDFDDIATIANQWLTPDPCVPDDMAYIPDGVFEMGGSLGHDYPHELPVHTVTVDSFYMGKYEITNQQYCDYLNKANLLGQIKVVDGRVYASSDSSNSYTYCDTHSEDAHSQIEFSFWGRVFSVMSKPEVGGRDMSNDPMVEVSWYGAVAYCNWRSGEEGYEACYNLSTWDCSFSKHGYRLPTEAEWEYAAQGGLPGGRFHWGDTISHSQANYYGRSDYPSYDISPTTGYHPTWDDGVRPHTSPVGSFAANGYGLYDMAGNVWDWCNDWYDSGYYDYSPATNPTGPTSGSDRVIRGGAWISAASFCRVASRTPQNPTYRQEYLGFRLDLDLD